MKPSDKAIKSARESIKRKEELKLDQQDFEMCLGERVCPKCAWLLDIEHVGSGEYGYKCTNTVCSFIHFKELPAN